MKALAIAVVAGCALTSHSTPVQLRYFTPLANTAPVVAPAANAPATSLRLGRIVPSSLLRTRIVHRDSSVELVPYETLRWSDPPETYVRRALAHALFDTRAFDEAVGGNGPVLDVDVLAFEEDRRGDRRFGRVALGYELRSEDRVVSHGVVEVEREARSPQIDAVVAAVGDALSAASAELAHRLAAP
ncbi:MAG TPA: ABC-type transport auxiliary lipoprotein family protein [Kofleriaceae bacterium]